MIYDPHHWDESKARRDFAGRFTEANPKFAARIITTSHEGRAMAMKRWKQQGRKDDRKNVMRRRWYARKRGQAERMLIEKRARDEQHLLFIGRHPSQLKKKRVDWSGMGKRST